MLVPVILKNPPMDSRLSQKAMPCLVDTTHETRQNLGAQAMHLRTRIRTQDRIVDKLWAAHTVLIFPIDVLVLSLLLINYLNFKHSVIHFCSVGGHAPVVMPYQNSGKILKIKLSPWIWIPNFVANASQLWMSLGTDFFNNMTYVTQDGSRKHRFIPYPSVKTYQLTWWEFPINRMMLAFGWSNRFIEAQLLASYVG